MKTKEVLRMIAEDMKNDAEAFDGRPFNGKTVAEYFGNQGAAIAALAKIIESLLPSDSVSATPSAREVAQIIQNDRYSNCCHQPVPSGYGHVCRLCGLEL